VGQVVHAWPEGLDVVGVTTLDDEVFLLRDAERDQVEVYDVITYRLLRRLTVPNCRWLVDMTSCKHYRCVYISDFDVFDADVDCIHRLDSQGAATQWPVNDRPMGISVNKAHHVLVVCQLVRKIKEFNTHGQLLRKLTLPDDVIHPWHAIQLTSRQFIVCHGGGGDAVNRVCTISADGKEIVRAHGGQRGSGTGQYKVRCAHLAADDNEFVFVVDLFNRRVTLLSPTLDFVRHVVSPDNLKRRLHLDVHRRRLYVVESEFKGGEFIGRVVVFSV